jgi:trehalose synthase-fused probable maltokinase
MMNGGSSTRQNMNSELGRYLRQRLPASLPAYLMGQRWFAGKAGRIASVEIVDIVALQEVTAGAGMYLIRVRYAESGAEVYALPLIANRALQETARPENKIACIQAGEVMLSDALQNEEFLNGLLGILDSPKTFVGGLGQIKTKASGELHNGRSSMDGLRGRLLKSEQSNSSIRYGDKLILKLFRKLSEGVNPELEMGEFLTTRAHFKHIPPVLGSMTYYQNGGGEFSLAVLQEFVPNDGDAWNYTLKQFAAFHVKATGSPNLDVNLRAREIPDEWLGPYLNDATKLGEITAEMHLALASDDRNPDFAIENWSELRQRESVAQRCDGARQIFELLRRNILRLPQSLRAEAEAIAARENEVTQVFKSALGGNFGGMIMRVHGDYHLGQVLHTPSDFVVIDFEGEPARPIAERRAKQSPLKDVAGMMRSFDYAAHSEDVARSGDSKHRKGDRNDQAALDEAWRSRVARQFVRGYLARAGQARFLPGTAGQFEQLLKIYLLEKAIYELQYELNSRPDWVGIPLGGIGRMLAS